MLKLTRHWILGGLLVMASGGLLLAKEGIVKTKDGRVLQGDVTEKENVVIVNVHGVEATEPRDNVVSVQYVEGIQQEYRQRLAALPKDANAKGHMDLARWLFENKQYDLSRTELDTVLRIDPNNTDANTLYQTVLSQQKMDRSHVIAPPATGTAVNPLSPGSAEHRCLTADEINTLRQKEWDPGDASVRVRFEGDVLKRYLNFSADVQKEFMALSAQGQAQRILAANLPDLRKDVKLTTDPVGMAEYKKAQATILSSCASAACHGGANCGGFFLYNPAESGQASYSNFYVLSTYVQTVNGVQYHMVDRFFPRKSLLVQYGLAPGAAEAPHPEVPKGTAWHTLPGFKNAEDVNYRRITAWIETLKQGDPDYGFKFVPQRPTTAPAAEPAPK